MDRHKYIGSSDARTIAAQLFGKFYNDKTNPQEREDLSDNFKVQFGSYVEPFHLEWLIEHQHPGWGWSIGVGHDRNSEPKQHFATAQFKTELGHTMVLGSHPDALLKMPDGWSGPCEVKHTGRFKDAEEAARFYMPQLQHHMICWQVDRLYFSVICGNEAPQGMWVGKSDHWCDWYIDLCARAWDFVAEKHAPPLDVGIEAVIPETLHASVSLDGMKIRHIEETDNMMINLLGEHNRAALAVDRLNEIKDDMKGAIKDDEKKLIMDGKFTITRNKAGHVILRVQDKSYGLETKHAGS